ncbi:MAG: ABC transporter substrate-binding protein [Acidobacteriota bacterium]
MSRKIAFATLFAFFPASVACSEGAESPAENLPAHCSQLTPVRLAVAVTDFGPGQAAFTSLPDALGYWKQECLDVEVLGFAGGAAAIQALEAGLADVCLSNTASLIGSVAAGSDVKAYFTHSTGNVFIPHVPEDSEIQSVADFRGKTIGVPSLHSGAVPMIRAMLDFEGLPAEAVDIVPVGTGESVIPLLQAGEVDVLVLFNTAHAQIEHLGVPLRPVSNQLAYSAGFTQTLQAARAAFEKRRGVLVGVARGLAKAMLFSNSNPEAGVRIHWTVFPESRPSGIPEDQALQQALLVTSVIQESTRPVKDIWGLATREQIEAQIEVQLRSGEIAGRVSVEEVWTDELLDEINDFDEPAVVEQARSYTLRNAG